MKVGFRNFDVIPEDGIELHLERSDAGALTLAHFNLRQILFRVAAQVAQFVKVLVDAGRDDPAVVQRQRRLGNKRAVDLSRSRSVRR